MSLKIKKKNPETTPAVSQSLSVGKSSDLVGLGVTGTAAVGMVSAEYKDGSAKYAQEKIKDVAPTSLPMASVEFSIGLTRNLGNYESVRIHVGVTMPCPATPDEIDNAYHEAKGWVDNRIEQVSAEIDSELGK